MISAAKAARAQLSLFDLPMSISSTSNEVAKMDTPPHILSSNDEWNRFIEGAEALGRTRIHVSLHWTAVVLERLVDFRLGHWVLWSNGRRVEYGPTPNPTRDKPLRVIYKSSEGALALHRSYPWSGSSGGLTGLNIASPGRMT